MNVSLKWAQDVSNVDISSVGVTQVVRKIGAQLGAVEQVINWGARYDGVVVVKVIECEKHPNADKLSVCLVDDGGAVKDVEREDGKLVRVVCGAPNIRKGQTVVWLPPGSTVPSTYDDKPFVLGARELRGVKSNGMIASPSELAISDDHDGILVLDQEVKPDTPFKDLFELDDYIIDCENKMFTHRPDCFGILGVARELAGIQHKKFTSPDWYVNEPILEELKELSVDVDVKTKLVSRFCAVAVKDVHIKPSPTQIQVDLTKVGIKPINNIVDITNWLMHLTGQPLHAYDYDKLLAVSGKKAANLTARVSKKGETLKLLNDKVVEMQDDDTVIIASGDVAVGIGGVMGGADTEVDENTKRVVFEAATFDMYNIRRTSMKYGLFTDAVTRFNKGQSPLQNAKVIAKAVEMANQIAGAKQASNLIDVKNATVKPKPNVSVSAEFINVRLGAKLKPKDIKNLLENVEFKVKVSGDNLSVQVPFWRMDIELPEDIVEEVGRLYGYDKLPVNLPKRTASPAAKNELSQFKSQIRSILSGVGANELLTYSFVHGDLLAKAGQDEKMAYKLSNALSPDLHYYRLSLLPSILEKVHPNIKAGFSEFALYEIGKAHTKKWVEDGLPIQAERIAFVFAADSKQAKNYEGQAYYQAKVYLDHLFNKLALSVQYLKFNEASKKIVESDTTKPYYQKRSAIVQTTDGEFIGTVGEFNQKIIKGLKLPDYVAGFELDINQLKANSSLGSKYVQIPKFPKVTQDISLKVASNVNFAELEKCVQDALRANQPEDSYAQISPLDIYQKGNDKHIAFRLIIASYEKTLTAKEVNDLLDKIADAANKRLKATRI